MLVMNMQGMDPVLIDLGTGTWTGDNVCVFWWRKVQSRQEEGKKE